jgi:hypothetical protein
MVVFLCAQFGDLPIQCVGSASLEAFAVKLIRGMSELGHRVIQNESGSGEVYFVCRRAINLAAACAADKRVSAESAYMLLNGVLDDLAAKAHQTIDEHGSTVVKQVLQMKLVQWNSAAVTREMTPELKEDPHRLLESSSLSIWSGVSRRMHSVAVEPIGQSPAILGPGERAGDDTVWTLFDSAREVTGQDGTLTVPLNLADVRLKSAFCNYAVLMVPLSFRLGFRQTFPVQTLFASATSLLSLCAFRAV